MQSTSLPSRVAVPFADQGSKQTIPVDSQINIADARASYTDGFPPLTRTPIAAGGKPPFGTDMNGILNAITVAIRWVNAGSSWAFNSDFASKVGGYPKGAIVPSSDGAGRWLNGTDQNSVDPEANTSSGWTPMGFYGSTAVTLTNANVTLTALQAGRDRLVLSGALTANVSVIVPNWLKRWQVTNNCTGAYSVTITTAAGTGVVVPGSRTSEVSGVASGDVTNIVALGNGAHEISRFTASGTWVSPVDGVVWASGAGGGGGGGGGAGYSSSSGNPSGGGGGAGASAVRVPITVEKGKSYAVTIGAAGTAGTSGAAGAAGGSGGAGGATSLGSLLTLPGGGGGGGGGTISAAAGGYGGAYGGQDGTDALAGAVGGLGGNGGSSPFGTAGGGGRSGTGGGHAPSAGAGFGAGGGGGGGGYNSGAAGAVGGAGMPGFLLIEY